MNKVLSVVKSFFLVAVFSLLSSCGDGGENKKIDIEILPDRPLVTNSEFTFFDGDGDEVNIEGPWFEMTYTIFNGSTRRLKVQTYSAEVTARGNDGTSTKSYSPNFGDFDTDRRSITEDPIEPGETFEEENNWIFDQLPDNSSFRYSVKIIFVGYYLTEDDPETEENEGDKPADRFEKTLRFNTR